MFRRRNSGTADSTVDVDVSPPEADGPAAASPAVTAGKGRPTPKRSEAEKRRRPFSAPADRKEANRQYRDRQKTERGRRMQGMQRGEQWAMPPRDRGPVKALARDYVDSKRRFSEFYMYGLLVLLVMLFIPSKVVQTIVPPLVIAAIVIMLVEGFFIGRKVRALAEERLPGESTHGIRLYSAMRTLQIRKLRVPKPRVKPGDSY
ncbi:MAG TPA: DUF3043 domain-containing protein [Streptosporangiaceae bacterium]